jgi:CheY-like chemotaxis protein
MKESILIVEDEVLHAMALQVTLEDWGFETAGVATTAKEAIEIARRERPGIVLMDISLEDAMDGIEAASMINRELGLPVVFMSGYGDEQVIERVRDFNSSSILKKPLDDHRLQTALKEALEKKEVA